MTTLTETIAHPKIVSRDEWLAARKELLAREKEVTHQRDALAAARRRLPMVRVDKDYAFDGPEGKVSLLDLFDGKRQLILYHFMFDPRNPPPGKSEPFSEGCSGCSFVADNVPELSHFRARDTNFVMVSRAPLAKIQPFQRRMGWGRIPWYSSFGSDFNYDFHVTIDESKVPVEYNFRDKAELQKNGQKYHLEGEQPGVSVFLRIGDEVYHTYSAYSRGLDQLVNNYTYLDLTPYGRREDWEESPEGWPQVPMMSWLRHHDKYEDSVKSEACCH